MQIALITIFPEMLSALEYGIPKQAQKKGLLEVRAFNPRDYAHDVHRTVDDRPYGGGPGMVMMVEPLEGAIETARDWLGPTTKVIYLSPQGQTLKQEHVTTLATAEKLILLAGRYEGIDERLVNKLIDEEWSLGDYILSGGELPALVLIDAITRLIPGALGHECSNQEDSFSDGLLDYPHYTRPEDFEGHKVPAVLLSGNHAEIKKWRRKQSLLRTYVRRPDLLANKPLAPADEKLLAEALNPIDNIE